MDNVDDQQVVTKQPDWKTRADYHQTLVSSDVFNSKNRKKTNRKDSTTDHFWETLVCTILQEISINMSVQ